MKITIKDVADKANVSAAAVSLSINNKPGVSEDTRQRVLQVARELGYEPLSKIVYPEAENIIRFLKISRHGHTVNKHHNYFIDSYVEGISATAYESGSVLEVEAYGSDEPLKNIINKMNDSPKITGYFILGTELSEDDIREFVKTGKNIVFVDTFLDYIPADFIDMNNTDAVYKLLNHFSSMGHTRIGLIKSSVNTRNFLLREKAFYQVMEKFQLEIKKEYIVDVDSTFEHAYSEFKNYLLSKPELPTVFFAINDIIAMGCMRALQDSGYSIPEDVSIAAFDNLPMSSMISPALTTIDVSKRDIGQTAFALLLTKAGREINSPPRKVLIGGRLIIRNSVKNLN